MRLRLAGGVVMAAELHAWIARPSGPVRIVDEDDAPPGAAVAMGPDNAADEQVQRAADELTWLVKAGGVVAAGAGVDLGDGFRSARLDGARGDQRDAVLAALRVLRLEGAGRLGDRAGFLVALFGPAVTKRVGATAARAIEEGRWPALHLATAASDVLGPEQLEQILSLTAPDGAEFIGGGLPSVLAVHLREVLEPLPGPRRLTLLLDMWERVSAHHEWLARRRRLLATQARQGRLDEMRERRRVYEEEQALYAFRNWEHGGEPTKLALIRWVPPDRYWYGVLNRMLQDAFSATALLRTAAAAADHGMAEGLARCEAVIAAAEAEVPGLPSARANKRAGGLPARPGSYVRDIHRTLQKVKLREEKFQAYLRRDDRFAAHIRPRLARARDYALLNIEDVGELVNGRLDTSEEVVREWAACDLRSWRSKVGYTSVRPPGEWGDDPPWTFQILGHQARPLVSRLADEQDPVVAEVETVGDMLWFAELIDALAQLYGHESAKRGLGQEAYLDRDPSTAPDEPLTPRTDSIALAVSGAAQLVALGGSPGRGVKTWSAYVESLRASTAIAEALSGEFSVPAVLTALDGTVVPGTGARFQIAWSARKLAEWSDYMGNCIASPHYVERATKGRSCLVALQDKTGRILVNAELRPARPATNGWLIGEIAARFNDSPDEALEKRFRRWVGTLPGTSPAEETAPVPDEIPATRPVRRKPPRRLFHEVGPVLAPLADRAWNEQVTGELTGTLAALADTEPEAALIRLRRLGVAQLKSACQRTVADGSCDLAGLWAATGVRPLESALALLDPALRERFTRLSLLGGDAPLSGSLRKLVKLPAIAPAYSLGLVGRRVRTAIGELVCDDDPAISRAVSRRVTPPLLCALAVAVTCRAPAIGLTPIAPPRTVAVPGFPATALDDERGPWQLAFPAARELGADTAAFWDQIADHGLRIPDSWLTTRAWPALWSHAHRHPPR